MVKYGTNARDAIWWPNLQQMQVVPTGAYSCTNPKSRDSRLELDNSRLTLDEKCLIRDEN